MLLFILLIVIIILLIVYLFSRSSTTPIGKNFTKNTDLFEDHSEHRDIERLRRELTIKNRERANIFDKKYGSGDKLNEYFAKNVDLITAYIQNPDSTYHQKWTENNHQLGMFLKQFKNIDLHDFDITFEIRFQYLVAKALGKPFNETIIKENQAKLDSYFD